MESLDAMPHADRGMPIVVRAVHGYTADRSMPFTGLYTFGGN